MPLTLTCPDCGTMLRAPDNAAGRRVRCPKCAGEFDVPGDATVQEPAAPPRPPDPPPTVFDEAPPRRRRRRDDYDDYDDYEDERPARRRRYRRQGTANLQMGLGIGSLSVGAVGLVFAFIPFCGAVVALPACGVGLILGISALVVALTRDKTGLGFPIAGSAVNVLAILVALVWLLVVGGRGSTWFGNPDLALRNGLATRDDQITALDRFDAVRQAMHCKIYTIDLQAGKSYQIDMMSQEGNPGMFDPYLRLEDPTGFQVAADDDGGGFPNARIFFQCQRTGRYRIICTTFNHGGVGRFRLTVQQR
jgi:hypothetical protein